MNVVDQETRLAKQLRSYLSFKSPVANAINLIRKRCARCFLFGGGVRDIVWPDPDLPVVRDLDFVVSGADIRRVMSECKEYVQGKNRFGGVRLEIDGVPVDMWAVEKTWAFRKDFVMPFSFYTLTRTTFLNIDGIVADLNTGDALGIKIFAKDFLRALTDRILDINLYENPYPSLVAMKALRAAYRYDLDIGFALASYIHAALNKYSHAFLEQEQQRHYKRIVFSREQLALLSRRLGEYLIKSPPNSAFSPNHQLTFPSLFCSGSERTSPAKTGGRRVNNDLTATPEGLGRVNIVRATA